MKMIFLVISFAKHNGNYSVSFKKIFERMPCIKDCPTVSGGNPLLPMAITNGGRGGASVLNIAKKRMPFNGGNVLDTFPLPNFSKNFNTLTGITNREL